MSIFIKILLLANIFAVVCIETINAQNNNAVIPGDFIIEPPTLINLGFEWDIQGDDNRNAEVDVKYRKAGDSLWNEALPMLRIGDERVWITASKLDYITPNMFAGSILDLKENTKYECTFTMTDPDGVKGQNVHKITVSTKGKPKEYKEGRTLHVYPPYYDGPREKPSFNGLKQAYYGPGGGDHEAIRANPIQPGDIILVHAGLYKADRFDYTNPYEIPFQGTYILTIDGTEEKPIVIKAAGDGEVIFDGNGSFRLFDVMAADYNYFEGITVRNTDIAFYAGLKDVLGCSGLVVKNCRMEDVGIGVLTEYAGSKNFYISDNVFLGREDQNRLLGWIDYGKYQPSPITSYYGVKVYGQGHVICYNSVSYFHDGICISTYGIPPKDRKRQGTAIDIYNNDIFASTDDFIEADGGVHNIRVMRNRGFNSAEAGISVQPIFGGPAYIIRNILYHIPMGGAIKSLNSNPAGILVYHNTFIADNIFARGVSNMHYRNNLFLGTDSPGKHILRKLNYTSYTTLDYNGYRPNKNGLSQFLWKAPAKGVLRDYTLQDKVGFTPYKTLEEFQNATGQDPNSLTLDYNIFNNVLTPDPEKPHAIYEIGDTDFRLKSGSKAIDAGCLLPNINNNFNGKNPDLGALEMGKDSPHYGPRY